MTERDRPARRVLVVEDEFWIAEDMADQIRALGFDVVGPIGNVETALRVIAEGTPIDGALLDINVGGELVYPVADALLERGIPVAFATGYDDCSLPGRYAGVPRHIKPVTPRVLRAALAAQMG